MNRRDWVVAIGTHNRWFDVNYWSVIKEMIDSKEETNKKSKANSRTGRRSKMKWD